jgi:hypothetical protein
MIADWGGEPPVRRRVQLEKQQRARFTLPWRGIVAKFGFDLLGFVLAKVFGCLLGLASMFECRRSLS